MNGWYQVTVRFRKSLGRGVGRYNAWRVLAYDEREAVRRVETMLDRKYPDNRGTVIRCEPE